MKTMNVDEIFALRFSMYFLHAKDTCGNWNSADMQMSAFAKFETLCSRVVKQQSENARLAALNESLDTSTLSQ